MPVIGANIVELPNRCSISISKLSTFSHALPAAERYPAMTGRRRTRRVSGEYLKPGTRPISVVRTGRPRQKLRIEPLFGSASRRMKSAIARSCLSASVTLGPFIFKLGALARPNFPWSAQARCFGGYRINSELRTSTFIIQPETAEPFWDHPPYKPGPHAPRTHESRLVRFKGNL